MENSPSFPFSIGSITQSCKTSFIASVYLFHKEIKLTKTYNIGIAHEVWSPDAADFHQLEDHMNQVDAECDTPKRNPNAQVGQLTAHT